MIARPRRQIASTNLMDGSDEASLRMKQQDLSKSKLMAYQQCPRRLWLEVHRKDLRQDDPAVQARFETGQRVGEIARQLYDQDNTGTLVVPEAGALAEAYARTEELLSARRPIFEAGFRVPGARALADIMLPVAGRGPRRWRMVEVKSTTSVKPTHLDDVALQAHVARGAGVRLASVAVAHLDGSWTYPGGEDYTGLLVEQDVTAQTLERSADAQDCIAAAGAVVRKRAEPAIRPGPQCKEPYPCGFIAHCSSQEPQAEHPVHWLPGARSAALKAFLADNRVTDMRDVPDGLLNWRQQRVKKHTMSGRRYFDAAGARDDLAGLGWPAYFMDFETVSDAVPVWAGTRPYEHVPFQFSVHKLGRGGRLSHVPFLDLSGGDPSRAFAQALIAACGDTGPIFVYNAPFENGRIEALARRFLPLQRRLMAIKERVVDLRPVAKQRYYHPRQQGGWGLKEVIGAMAPGIAHDKLKGVRDGGMAMDAYREATAPGTTAARKEQLRTQLLAYCALDTFALVRMWGQFTGRPLPA